MSFLRLTTFQIEKWSCWGAVGVQQFLSKYHFLKLKSGHFFRPILMKIGDFSSIIATIFQFFFEFFSSKKYQKPVNILSLGWVSDFLTNLRFTTFHSKSGR